MKTRTCLLTLAMCLQLASLVSAQSKQHSLGINLCGPEFGERNVPGILNVDYVYPTVKEIDYFAKKGFTLVHLPFRWERVQHKLNGLLDVDEMRQLSKFIYNCNNRGMKVMLTMHNFGRYRLLGEEYVIGSPEVSREAFADVWKRMALILRTMPNIYGYNIMNEPHHMGDYKWATTAQNVINTIRQVDKKTAIIIGGDNYADALNWYQYSDDLKYLKDNSNNLIYDAHCYFDDDHSGKYYHTYDECNANPLTGVKRIDPFLNWLKQNGKKGIIGECGIPGDDPRWVPVLDNFLNHVRRNGLMANYWAAGPWWHSYKLSIEPNFEIDKPQMEILAKHIAQPLKTLPYIPAGFREIPIKRRAKPNSYTIQPGNVIAVNTVIAPNNDKSKRIDDKSNITVTDNSKLK